MSNRGLHCFGRDCSEPGYELYDSCTCRCDVCNPRIAERVAEAIDALIVARLLSRFFGIHDCPKELENLKAVLREAGLS